MIETLVAVFAEGSVFKRVLVDTPSRNNPRSVSAAAEESLPRFHSDGVEVGFVSTRVMRTLRKKCVFYAGGVPVLLWGDAQSAHKKELLDRLQNVASLTKERLLADFPRNDVRSALAIFDRRLVQKGFGPLPDTEVRRFLLRGARRLANLLGCEEEAVILQYQSALPYMIEQMQPLQPLAGKTNQEAWAILLDDATWESACPARLRVSSRSLRMVIRFYISIEDGECTVERDLGEFREQIQEHRTSNMEFIDDSLVMRLNGPRTAAEYHEDVADSRVALTPFSRGWASLWRQLYGTRFGHYNAKATAAAKLKRQRKPGVYRGVALGVLSAARLAVAKARQRAAQARNPDSVVHPGAGTTESLHWNDSMSKFQERSYNNIPGTTQTRVTTGGAFVKPTGVNLAESSGAQVQPLAHKFSLIPKVAVAGAGEMEMCPAKRCKLLTGPHRCAEADLVVVPDLSVLHDLDKLAANVDLAICFLYIVSLGLTTTTKSLLAAVEGIPKRLSPQQCVRHVSAAKALKVTFCVGPRLSVEHPKVQIALHRIARAPASKFILSKNSEPAPGDVFVDDLRDVVAWACSVRKAENERGPKAFVADGAAMPT